MMKTARLVAQGVVVVATGCLIGSLAVSAAFADDAKQTYDKTCVPCHGAAGKGDGPAAKMLKPPPQDFPTALKGKSDADISKIIKEGGKAVGKAASMPAYGAKLNDDQIKGMVEYIKSLK